MNTWAANLVIKFEVTKTKESTSKRACERPVEVNKSSLSLPQNGNLLHCYLRRAV